MKVLVACEFSGIVRDAFRKRGHDAWSCDILSCERNPEYHIQDDVLKHLDDGWDLLIAHPPCTFLTNAGSKHLYINGKFENGRDKRRWRDMNNAVHFFKAFLFSGIPRICVENPIMHKYARALVRTRYSQIIQPYEYGHAETKATCLWLKGLPLLVPTKIVKPDYEKYPPGKGGNGYEARVFLKGPGPERWKNRSRTMTGIAKAMASQWGNSNKISLV